jgi:aminomethyltransferase
MLKRTALFEEHTHLKGRLIDFGGWELPVQYSGLMDEHLTCRTACGLFDVSHMGEVHVEGPDAESFLNELVSNNVSAIFVGQAQYSVMCNDEGGIVDDLIIYRRAPDRFLVVINASNTEKDVAWMEGILKRRTWNLKFENVSAHYSQIALQGRHAEAILQKLTETPLHDIKNYWFKEGMVLHHIPAILARTGYTGEDGFEIYVPWKEGPAVWRALLEAGQPYGIKPCGLGARDTLRLEVKYPLYGNELSDHTHPLEAGLGWVVKLDKKSFIGKQAIEAKKAHGLKNALVGLTLKSAGVPRQGYKIFDSTGNTEIGMVTSGTQSPSLKKSIALGYVTIPHSAIGTQIQLEIRGNKIPAEIIPTPFYKRNY